GHDWNAVRTAVNRAWSECFSRARGGGRISTMLPKRRTLRYVYLDTHLRFLIESWRLGKNAGSAPAIILECWNVHWCLGMYGSGSTWLYNVTRQIAASVDPTKPVQGDFVSRFIDTARLEQPGRTYIVKSHEIDDEEAVAVLSARA